jgi:glycosyltransferase involved in cell wall biosynthesis
VELCPWQLLPWRYPQALAKELVRNAMTRFQLSPAGGLGRRCRQATVVVTSSPAVAAAVLRFGVVPQVIPTLAVEPVAITAVPLRAPDEPLRLLYVGRLEYWKGITLALEALARSQTRVRLTIVGDGPLRHAATKLACRLGLHDRVQFLGAVARADVLPLYRQHDVFCFPSMHDHWPMVVLEAMIHGLPVICLRTGGPASMVPDGAGTQVAVAGHELVVADLARAIRAYDQDRNLCRQQGEAARAHAYQVHTWEQRARAMNQVYHQAVLTNCRKET